MDNSFIFLYYLKRTGLFLWALSKSGFVPVSKPMKTAY